MGMSYIECRNIPIRYRTWFIDRIVKEIKNTGSSKSANDNSADARALMGKDRAQVPAKLRRFT
jgi:hypothetical protein